MQGSGRGAFGKVLYNLTMANHRVVRVLIDLFLVFDLRKTVGHLVRRPMNRTGRSLFICLILTIGLPIQAIAKTWHILPDGFGSAPTIQAGIDSANVGDTVLVAPGTYVENI